MVWLGGASPATAAFLTVEIVVGLLPEFQLRSALVLRGVPYAPAQKRELAARNQPYDKPPTSREFAAR
jgi:hypothetical protein